MKLSWGRKLVLGAILFMTFIVSMIVYISKQDVPLVESNYYEVGLDYQHQMQLKEGADSLIRIQLNKFDTTNPLLQLWFTHPASKQTGMLFLMKPSDKSQDFKIPFEVMAHDTFTFSFAGQSVGEWNVNAVWTDSIGQHKYATKLLK